VAWRRLTFSDNRAPDRPILRGLPSRCSCSPHRGGRPPWRDREAVRAAGCRCARTLRDADRARVPRGVTADPTCGARRAARGLGRATMLHEGMLWERGILEYLFSPRESRESQVRPKVRGTDLAERATIVEEKVAQTRRPGARAESRTSPHKYVIPMARHLDHGSICVPAARRVTRPRASRARVMPESVTRRPEPRSRARAAPPVEIPSHRQRRSSSPHPRRSARTEPSQVVARHPAAAPVGSGPWVSWNNTLATRQLGPASAAVGCAACRRRWAGNVMGSSAEPPDASHRTADGRKYAGRHPAAPEVLGELLPSVRARCRVRGDRHVDVAELAPMMRPR
jgi:hypothetical protein